MLDCLELIQNAIYEVAKKRGDEFRYEDGEDLFSDSPSFGDLKGLCVPATLTVHKLLEDLGRESEVVRAKVSKNGEKIESHYFLLIPSEDLNLSGDDTGKRMITETVEYEVNSRERPQIIWDPTRDQYISKLLISETPPKGKTALEYLKGEEETMIRFDRFYNAVFEELEKTKFMEDYMCP